MNRYLLAVSAAVMLAGTAVGQVTTSSLQIGGTDAPSCASATNPPTLPGGAPLTGMLDYSFNAVTQILTLTVSNTSPVTPGVANPIITRVFANLPQTAVAGAMLISQTAAGGPTPAWTLAIDPNNVDGMNSIFGSCFGKFGLVLEGPAGIGGGIANPLADPPAGPAGAALVGPVVFQIQIIPSSGAGAGLIAEAFAHSRSINPPGTTATNAAFKFQGTAENETIGNAPTGDGGSPAAWVVGDLMGGQTVTAFSSGTPGWLYCMVAALTPGPIVVAGITFPIGPDFFEISGGIMPPAGIAFTDVNIPTNPPAPEIASVTFYAIVVLASPDHRTISVSEQFSLSVVF